MSSSSSAWTSRYSAGNERAQTTALIEPRSESGAGRQVPASPADSGADETTAALDRWRANVGDPVSLDLAAPALAAPAGVDVLCWNLAVGAARVAELLAELFDGRFGDVARDPRRPFILLAQEAFRSDASVPAAATDAQCHGGAPHPEDPTDVVAVARAFSLSLRYAPSMRNGSHASDRGNAILASAALEASGEFALPFVRQRRVVVTAALAGAADVMFASAHLDVAGRARSARRTLRFGSGRVVQARALAERLAPSAVPRTTVLGADLNTQLGMRDPAVRALVSASMRPAERRGAWRHTFHGPVRLLLDHVLYRSHGRTVARAHVTRIDEWPGDRGRRVYGSDHHPLLARIDFAT